MLITEYNGKRWLDNINVVLNVAVQVVGVNFKGKCAEILRVNDNLKNQWRALAIHLKKGWMEQEKIEYSITRCAA